MTRPPPPPRSVLTLGAPPLGGTAVLSAAQPMPTFGLHPLELPASLAEHLGELKPAGLIVPGEDAALSAAERRVGRVLSELLRGPQMQEIARWLERLSAASRISGLPLDLLLDLRTPELRALPWELLELLPSGEPLGGCRVARLMEGARLTADPSRGLEVLVWSPTPDDPDCARVASSLERTLDRLPQVRRARRGDPTDNRAWRVVHVICHGGERGEPVLELGSARALDAATLGRVLEPVLSAAALVVLDVCGAGQGGEAAALPAWRVVDAGAAACLAPRAALDVEASIAMSEALYGALAEGEPLLAAVAAARRGIAALGLPDPAARWWTLNLVVSDPALLDRPPIPPRVHHLPGLERASPEAAHVLARGAEIATAHGFFGLEHLAIALTQLPSPPTAIALAQTQLQRFAARSLRLQLTGLTGPRVTPRLRAMLEGMEPGFGLRHLLRGLAQSRPCRLETPSLIGLTREATPISQTVSGDQPGVEAPSAPLGAAEAGGLWLEVLGGPEDGLLRTLTRSCATLGRWDPNGAQPDVAQLYAGAGAVDEAVSRRHLRWLGGAVIEPLAPVGLRTGDVLRPLRGPTALKVGDLLELGNASRLEVVSVPR